MPQAQAHDEVARKAGEGASTEPGPATSAESVAAHSARLGGLADAERLPDLRAAIDAGALDYPPDTPATERRFDYAFGLACILDGVEALIRERTAAAGPAAG
ncbi:hypothetical protein GCM10027570_41420 [Streptomonospora sediminis]